MFPFHLLIFSYISGSNSKLIKDIVTIWRYGSLGVQNVHIFNTIYNSFIPWKTQTQSQEAISLLKQGCRVLGQKFQFLLFWYMLQPYLSSFQNGAILYSNIVTFDFMIIYVKGVSSNIGKNALYRKNGQFWHKMRWI